MKPSDISDSTFRLLRAMMECEEIQGILILVHARDYLRDTYILKIGQ